ncbi:MAG: glycosyltransferase family 1 protein [Candidatus Pacebacteria bacterium]|nr:glycosyltransferase family 1 protein [Candidatus Paceibacterota bacterium]
MKIGIDASRAFISKRTGIEEYSYQTIKHLRNKLDKAQVFLYLRKNQKVDFDLPENWKVKIINWPRLWTQAGLSLELLFHPVDVLFVPGHVAPLIHPRNTIVTIHGLEFETYPAGYSFWERSYMRFAVKLSCRFAKKIIAVSKNTKKDLTDLYKITEGKIEVVHEGVNNNFQFSIFPATPDLAKRDNFQTISNDKISNYKPYLLFIGRLEKRKNIEGIIDAYKILVEKHKIPHGLVLMGGPGYGFETIKLKIENCKLKIETLGYVDEAVKWKLLSHADIFLFPSFYEGFGLPVLEAQGVGTPVVTSNVSSLLEVAGEGAAYCVPGEPFSIAEAAWSIIRDKDFRESVIEKGQENVKRFSWEKCAEEIAKILTGEWTN